MKTKTKRPVVILAVAAAVSVRYFGSGVTRAATPVATVAGTVKFDGPAPKRTVLSMVKEPTCAAIHKTPPLAEDVVVGPDGALENVVIYISEGLPDMVWDAQIGRAH